LSPPAKIICKHCGERFEKGLDYCPFCGFPASNQEEDKPSWIGESFFFRLFSFFGNWLFSFSKSSRKLKSNSTDNTGKKDSAGIRKDILTTKRSLSKSWDSMELLQQAHIYSDAHDYKRAKACATEAIQANPKLIDAYMVRALAYRMTSDLDHAIEDYSKVIDQDSENNLAWMFRGACKCQKASALKGQKKETLMSEAHPDYKRASELRPDDELAGLALLELEIIIDKYLEAIGTGGIWWNRIQGGGNKIICAWLAALANIFAGRPARRWNHYKEFLENDKTQLRTNDWCVAEIDSYIKDYNNKHRNDENKLEVIENIKNIHNLFLSHFTDEKPLL